MKAGRKKARINAPTKTKDQTKAVEKTVENDKSLDQSESPYGGIPSRSLKKNLGCG